MKFTFEIKSLRKKLKTLERRKSRLREQRCNVDPHRNRLRSRLYDSLMEIMDEIAIVENAGNILPGISKKHKLQFLQLLENYVTAPGLNAAKFLTENPDVNGMGFTLEYDTAGNMTGISYKKLQV